MINKVVLMGRLVKDPELRYTGSGTAVTNFTVAVDDGFGENRTTSFINCVAWSKSAEFVGNYFSKGKMIIVIGRIQTRTWDGQDGKKNYITEVVASEVSFGETRKILRKTHRQHRYLITTMEQDAQRKNFRK